MPLQILAPRHLDYANPVNLTDPLNRGLRGWWKVLPQRLGGPRWLDLLQTTPASMVEMLPSTATRGWGAQAPPGGFGSVQLDGVSRVHIPHRSWMQYTGGNLTVSLWVWLTPGQDDGYFISKPWNIAGNYNWYLYLAANGTLYLTLSGATLAQFASSSPVPFGSWQWLAWTFSADARMRLWINRSLVVDQSHSIASWTPPNAESPVDLVIGNLYPYSAPWAPTSSVSVTGRIDDLRIATRAFSAGEIAALYQQSRLRYPTTLRSRAPLHIVPQALDLGTPPDPDAIPTGITVLWSGTAASIPTGWERETALDGRYPRGAPAATDGGGTGGSATHSHTSTAHSHTTAHTHTVPNSTATQSATNDRDNSNTNPPQAHTHASNPAAPNPTTTTADEAPTTDAVNHEPAYIETLFLRSLGVTHGFPASTIGLWANSAGAPAGWTLCDGASGRPDYRSTFPKGAGAGANPGATGGGSTTHSHTLPSHSHGETYSHTHPGVTSGIRTETLTTGTVSGGQALTATGAHTHALTFSTPAPAITAQGDSTSSTVLTEPPYAVLAYLQNISGVLQETLGIIALWLGTEATIPDRWDLCDGTNGTPDLRNLFVKGADTLGGIGGSGGSSAAHGHTANGHTHAIAAHVHTVTGAAGTSENRTAGATPAPTSVHTHTWPDTSSNGLTSGSTAPTLAEVANTLPPYVNVLFVQWQAAPGPITATATLVQDTQTVSSTASVAVQATATLAQATQTVASTAALAVQATATLMQDTQTVLGVGSTVPLTYSNGRVDFTNRLTLAIPGTLHGHATAALLIQVYDAGTPATRLSVPIAVHAGTYDVTISFPAVQSGYVLLSAGALSIGQTFSAVLSVTVPQSTHGFATPNLLVEVYDAQTPAQLVQAHLDVEQTAPYTVTASFATAQSGRIVIGNAASSAPSPNVSLLLSNQSSPYTVPGSTHGLGSPHLLPQVYDASTPAVALQVPTTVDASTYDVTLTFPGTLSGRLVLGGLLESRTATATLMQDVQTLSSTAALVLVATSSLMQAEQSLSSAAALAIQATVTALQDSQTLLAMGMGPGAGILGALNVTQDMQTVNSQAVLELRATSILSQETQSLSSSAVLALAASASLAQEVQTVAAGGTLALQASLMQMQADQTVTSSATLPVVGTALLLQGDQTISSQAVLAVQGTASLTQDAQVLQALAVGPGGGILGAATLLQAAQSISSTSSLTLVGSATLLQDVQSVSSTASLGLAATAVLVQAAQTSTGSARLAVQGSLSQQQDDQTVSSSAQLPVVASAVLAQANQTVSSSATLPIQATAVLLQAPQTVQAIGVGPGAGILGVALLVQAEQSMSSAGRLQIAATLTVMQASQTVLATGEIAPIVADAVLVQDMQSVSSTARLALGATLSQTQEAQTLVAVTHLALAAQALLVQADQTSSSQARVQIQASASLVYEEQTCVSFGSELPPPRSIRATAGRLERSGQAVSRGLVRSGVGKQPTLI